MNLPYLPILVLSVCAITFYRVGRHERSWGTLWAALSIAASLIAMRFFGSGMMSIFLAQILLFVAITFYRMWKPS